MSETLLLIKRTGIDTTWQVAPYPIKDREHAQWLVGFLNRTWRVPFEFRITADISGNDNGR